MESTSFGFVFGLSLPYRIRVGYDVTILRSANGKQVPISLNEAISAAEEIGGWRYSESPPTFEFSRDEADCTLWYNDGTLWAKTPDRWELEPMLLLAERLKARVRGEEFETYESPDKTFFHPDDVQLKEEAEAKSRELLSSRRRPQKHIRNIFVGAFLGLRMVGYLIGKWLEKK